MCLFTEIALNVHNNLHAENRSPSNEITINHFFNCSQQVELNKKSLLAANTSSCGALQRSNTPKLFLPPYTEVRWRTEPWVVAQARRVAASVARGRGSQHDALQTSMDRTRHYGVRQRLSWCNNCQAIWCVGLVHKLIDERCAVGRKKVLTIRKEKPVRLERIFKMTLYCPFSVGGFYVLHEDIHDITIHDFFTSLLNCVRDIVPKMYKLLTS